MLCLVNIVPAWLVVAVRKHRILGEAPGWIVTVSQGPGGVQAMTYRGSPATGLRVCVPLPSPAWS